MSPTESPPTETQGFFNGHRIVRHAKAGAAWFPVDDRDYPRFDSCAEAAEWIDKHLAKDKTEPKSA